MIMKEWVEVCSNIVVIGQRGGFPGKRICAYIPSIGCYPVFPWSKRFEVDLNPMKSGRAYLLLFISTDNL
ncbi:hypothetical protein CHM34_03315 [Paludifilum halophilum]|uniref:Uncharacterized protein n=1 Tax=Paludifilum halophilum TaxID=1642702 RepID=A0A235B996_9BACL|nr:hypothetical protein CHM34_03315 [Paludifilum halophilum]